MPITIPHTGTKAQKSVKLTKEDWLLLKKLRVSACSDIAFSCAIGVSRTSLIRICDYGSGSEANIKKVKTYLKNHKHLANAEN